MVNGIVSKKFLFALGVLLLSYGHQAIASEQILEQRAKERVINKALFITGCCLETVLLTSLSPTVRHAWHSFAERHSCTAKLVIPLSVLGLGLYLSHDYQNMVDTDKQTSSRKPIYNINKNGIRYAALAAGSIAFLQNLLTHGGRNTFGDIKYFVEHPITKKYAVSGCILALLMQALKVYIGPVV